MDAATATQKAFIKKLFMKCGVPRWVFNPLKMWNISRPDAKLLINSLKIMKNFSNDDLKEVIWRRLEERNAFKKFGRSLRSAMSTLFPSIWLSGFWTASLPPT